MEVVVEYDYVGQEDDELSLKEGDVINDVIKMDGGWWEGTLNGKRGMFPDNFVKVQEVKKENVRVKEAPGAPKQDSSGGHVAEMASRLANEGGIRMGGQSAPGITKRISTGPAVVPPTNRQNSREPSIDNESKDKVFAKVTFHYTPQQKDELKLVKGDIVEVIKQEEEGWWEGVLNGRSGVFPSHFVELLSEAKPKGEGFEEIKGKKIKGVGLGNIFSEGPIKLRKGQLRGGNQEMEEEPTAACRTKLRDKGSPPVEPKNMQNKGVPLPSVPRDVPAVPPKEAKELKSAQVPSAGPTAPACAPWTPCKEAAGGDCSRRPGTATPTPSPQKAVHFYNMTGDLMMKYDAQQLSTSWSAQRLENDGKAVHFYNMTGDLMMKYDADDSADYLSGEEELGGYDAAFGDSFKSDATSVEMASALSTLSGCDGSFATPVGESLRWSVASSAGGEYLEADVTMEGSEGDPSRADSVGDTAGDTTPGATGTSGGDLDAGQITPTEEILEELSGLSHARQTPPPKRTSFTQRRKSRGTPKSSYSPVQPLHHSTPSVKPHGYPPCAGDNVPGVFGEKSVEDPPQLGIAALSLDQGSKEIQVCPPSESSSPPSVSAPVAGVSRDPHLRHKRVSFTGGDDLIPKGPEEELCVSAVFESCKVGTGGDERDGFRSPPSGPAECLPVDRITDSVQLAKHRLTLSHSGHHDQDDPTAPTAVSRLSFTPEPTKDNVASDVIDAPGPSEGHPDQDGAPEHVWIGDRGVLYDERPRADCYGDSSLDTWLAPPDAAERLADLQLQSSRLPRPSKLRALWKRLSLRRLSSHRKTEKEYPLYIAREEEENYFRHLYRTGRLPVQITNIADKYEILRHGSVGRGRDYSWSLGPADHVTCPASHNVTTDPGCDEPDGPRNARTGKRVNRRKSFSEILRSASLFGRRPEAHEGQKQLKKPRRKSSIFRKKQPLGVTTSLTQDTGELEADKLKKPRRKSSLLLRRFSLKARPAVESHAAPVKPPRKGLLQRLSFRSKTDRDHPTVVAKHFAAEGVRYPRDNRPGASDGDDGGAEETTSPDDTQGGPQTRDEAPIPVLADQTLSAVSGCVYISAPVVVLEGDSAFYGFDGNAPDGLDVCQNTAEGLCGGKPQHGTNPAPEVRDPQGSAGSYGEYPGDTSMFSYGSIPLPDNSALRDGVSLPRMAYGGEEEATDTAEGDVNNESLHNTTPDGDFGGAGHQGSMSSSGAEAQASPPRYDASPEKIHSQLTKLEAERDVISRGNPWLADSGRAVSSVDDSCEVPWSGVTHAVGQTQRDPQEENPVVVQLSGKLGPMWHASPDPWMGDDDDLESAALEKARPGRLSDVRRGRWHESYDGVESSANSGAVKNLDISSSSVDTFFNKDPEDGEFTTWRQSAENPDVSVETSLIGGSHVPCPGLLDRTTGSVEMFFPTDTARDCPMPAAVATVVRDKPRLESSATLDLNTSSGSQGQPWKPQHTLDQSSGSVEAFFSRDFDPDEDCGQCVPLIVQSADRLSGSFGAQGGQASGESAAGRLLEQSANSVEAFFDGLDLSGREVNSGYSSMDALRSFSRGHDERQSDDLAADSPEVQLDNIQIRFGEEGSSLEESSMDWTAASGELNGSKVLESEDTNDGACLADACYGSGFLAEGTDGSAPDEVAQGSPEAGEILSLQNVSLNLMDDMAHLLPELNLLPGAALEPETPYPMVQDLLDYEPLLSAIDEEEDGDRRSRGGSSDASPDIAGLIQSAGSKAHGCYYSLTTRELSQAMGCQDTVEEEV